MSMSGQRLLELEQERKEQLRLAQVRAECLGVVDACEATLRDVRDVTVQQLAAGELREVAATLATARAQVEGSPDAAIAVLSGVHERMHAAIAKGEALARAWSEQQAGNVARARAAVQRAAVVGTLGGDADAGATAKNALANAEAGDLAASARLLDASVGNLGAARVAALDESVRREVVKGLLRSLKDMGFVTVGPQVAAGVVTLEGRLASGRRARFEVSVEGGMAFDLDGYEGRACAEDMEKVEVSLRDRFGVKLGPPQVVWKNPDRLSKGAKDVPGGNTRKRG
jgi:hypothetical protein